MTSSSSSKRTPARLEPRFGGEGRSCFGLAAAAVRVAVATGTAMRILEYMFWGLFVLRMSADGGGCGVTGCGSEGDGRWVGLNRRRGECCAGNCGG